MRQNAPGAAVADEERSAKRRACAALVDARRQTLALLERMPDDELLIQPSTIVSPPVWDLAHIGYFEELWLLRRLSEAPSLFPEHDRIYDAFAQPRAGRAALPLLEPSQARAYLSEVRERSLALLDELDLSGGERLLRDGYVHGMVAQHELQHIETMLGTFQLREDLRFPLPEPEAGPVDSPEPGEARVEAGPFLLGGEDAWGYDNERPAHAVELETFLIDISPVTNGGFLAFVEAGGYEDPSYWDPLGWRFRLDEGLEHPLFWRRESDGSWTRVRFGRREPVPPDEPVQHVSWYEADAYARWVGKRLPTEAEWEKAASWDVSESRKLLRPWGDEPWRDERANLGARRFGPAPIGSYAAGASPCGCRQMLGDVWEWTASAFRPYPGFESFPYREYSEVFFGDDFRVLRGGSWATAPLVARVSFRNWDYPIRRQIFAGFRCARDPDR
ncbi:MAG: ergothioneine biosynthesis protein EgtB [Gaiellaceae bacterium]